MVGSGIVAVGRSGGMISDDWDRFPRNMRGRATDMPTKYRWDHRPTSPRRIVTWSDGSIMRRAFAMAAVAISLAGCTSFSGFDYFRSTPPTVRLQLESTPPGADARTSIGPGCKTPCAVSVTPPDAGFTVSYSMPGVQPVNIPVQVVKDPGGMFAADTFRITPNPVVAELRPPPPPPPRKPMRPKRKKPAAPPAGAPAQ